MSAAETTLPLTERRPPDVRKDVGVVWVFPDPQPTLSELKGDSISLGRSPECDIPLTAPHVSRQHAEIFREGPLWKLRDHGSRNGTYHEGHRIEAPVALGPGQALRLGGAVGVVVELSAYQDAPPRFAEWAPGIWGGNPIRRLVAELETVARSDLSVVLHGESGSGKECFARALHAFSGRSGPFIAVNCAALPEQLAEAELFGHRKGAFTGADRSGAGYLRAAHEGTLLLDEVIELPLPIQAKLLRAVENREVIPLGQTEAVPTNVRWIAAAQRSLFDQVEKNAFRADLYARLVGSQIAILPLRERREDVPFLFQHFFSIHCGGRAPPVSAPFVECLCVYGWPLNVRELELLAKRLAVMHGLEPRLGIEHLPEVMTRQSAPANSEDSTPSDDGQALGELTAFMTALRNCEGNVLKASAKSGISRQRAYRLIAIHDIDLNQYRAGKS